MRRLSTTRRRFAFLVGLGLFQLSERLSADGLDRLAASAMRLTEPANGREQETPTEHWSVAENRTWWWYQRENLVDGQWEVTGITTPIHKQTSKRYDGETGYLDDGLVPDHIRMNDRRWRTVNSSRTVQPASYSSTKPGDPDPIRKARHGRPPSDWLRSLNASELRVWLKTIDVPEAGVEGMTYFTHLTRDHFFEGRRIGGLTISEQAKLHAAAHAGY